MVPVAADLLIDREDHGMGWWIAFPLD